MSGGLALALAAAAQGFQGDLLRLIGALWAVAKAVLLILLAFSVLSWAVIIDRARALGRAERDTLSFLREMEGERRLSDLRDRAGRFEHSPLLPVFLAGFRELTTGIADGIGRFRGNPAMPEEARDQIVRRVRHRVEVAAASEADRLDQHLGLLATTGAVTPFIGLFGTVWGIMNAFQGIGMTGSASLAAVAPGISEALVTTAAGLAAAIPAVVAYNLLLARARRLGGRIERFVLSFVALAEAQVEAGRSGAVTMEAGKARP